MSTLDNLYADLIIQSGQTCVVHGDSTVLYYRSRAALSSTRGASTKEAMAEHVSNILQLLN
jgi:hypothetical protein